MSICLANDDFAQKVDNLKKRLRLRMNGATTEQMEKRCLDYAINYGAQLPHIKEMAKTCSFSPDECRKLWQLNIRETMLLATMLMPDPSAEEASVWAQEVRTPDMAEQAAFFFFCRTTDFDSLASRLISSSAPYCRAIVCFAAGRRLLTGAEVSHEAAAAILGSLQEPSVINKAEARAISLFLRQLVRHDVQRSLVDDIIKAYEDANLPELQSVVFEVKNEIECTQ